MATHVVLSHFSLNVRSSSIGGVSSCAENRLILANWVKLNIFLDLRDEVLLSSRTLIESFQRYMY